MHTTIATDTPETAARASARGNGPAAGNDAPAPGVTSEETSQRATLNVPKPDAAGGSEFDAERWIDQAIAAGIDPMAIAEADGRHGLATKEIDIDRHLAPERLLTTTAQTAIVDALIARGRVWNLKAGESMLAPHAPASAPDPDANAVRTPDAARGAGAPIAGAASLPLPGEEG